MAVSEILLIIAIIIFLAAAFITYGRTKVIALTELGLAAFAAAVLLAGRVF